MAGLTSIGRKPLLCRRRPGASLVEVLISMIIVAVVLLGIISAVFIARVSIVTKEEETARQICLNVLEDMERIKLVDLPSAVVASPQGTYVVEKTVSPNPVSADAVVAEVTVTVRWGTEGKSVSMSREVSSSGNQNIGFPK